MLFYYIVSKVFVFVDWCPLEPCERTVHTLGTILDVVLRCLNKPKVLNTRKYLG